MTHPDTDSYRFGYPDLLTRIFDYFDPRNAMTAANTIVPHTVKDFFSAWEPSSNVPQPGAVDEICQRMVRSGYLSYFGSRPGGVDLDGFLNTYLSNRRISLTGKVLAKQMNCDVYGFPYIYDQYRCSVLAVAHTGRTGITQLGTCFAIAPNRLLTAAHCLDNAEAVAIQGVSASLLKDAYFVRANADEVDLAMVVLTLNIVPEDAIVPMGHPVVLQDVMAMGYPDVPGFVPAIAAEKAIVSSRLSPVVGSVASTPFEMWARSELLLITARVRGGFSGGPVINARGHYVGVVLREPSFEDTDLIGQSHRYDNLGYGVAVPTGVVARFLGQAGEDNLTTVPTDMSSTRFVEFA